MKRTLWPFALAFVLMTAGLAGAGSVPLGGLTVAVDGAGKTLVLGGDSRTLYVLDAATLEVGQRVWIQTPVVRMSFNKAGDRLLFENTDGTGYLMDAKSWALVQEMKKMLNISPARSADLVAALDDNYNGHVIRVMSLTDLSEKARVTFPKEEKVEAFGLDAAGARLAVLMKSEKDDSEPTVKETPKDLKGIDADEFKLKNDGKTALLRVYEMPGGKVLAEHKLWYSASSSNWTVFFRGDDVMIANYSNLNAKVSKDGNVALFQLDNSYNYGIGISADQNILLSGGLANGTYTRMDALKMTKFDIQKLPGWPEYFKGFDVGPDGTGYGATTAYRVFRFSKDGGVEKSAPVF